MNTTATNAIDFYLKKGLSKDIAVGICAVLYVESALNPLAMNNSGTETVGVLNPKGSYGVAQWNGPRQAALATFASKENLSPSDINTQLQFVLTESANSYPLMWAAIRNPATTYQEMIEVMVSHYEIPADIPKEIAAATAYALAWYPLVGTVTATPVTPGVTNATVTAAAQIEAAIAVLQTALKSLNVT